MRWPTWLGVGERRWKKSPNEEVQPAKTAWDWLQLLIVPAILAAIAVAFNAAETSRDRSREDRRTREDRALARAAREDSTLNAYLGQMSDLMLKQHLLDAGPKSAAAIVARTITLVTIGRLDGERKGQVVRFLYGARLLQGRKPLVNLEGADLRGVDLRFASLFGSSHKRLNLSGTDLRGAKFDGGILAFADLEYADLRGASFYNALVTSVSLLNSDLRRVNFDHVDFDEPDFKQSNPATSFADSCLTNASFVGAVAGVIFDDAMGRNLDFSKADLSGASTTNAALTYLRLQGTQGRPREWGPTGTPNRDFNPRSGARHPCSTMQWPEESPSTP